MNSHFATICEVAPKNTQWVAHVRMHYNYWSIDLQGNIYALYEARPIPFPFEPLVPDPVIALQICDLDIGWRTLHLTIGKNIELPKICDMSTTQISKIQTHLANICATCMSSPKYGYLCDGSNFCDIDNYCANEVRKFNLEIVDIVTIALFSNNILEFYI